jgi:hypothetical protein
MGYLVLALAVVDILLSVYVVYWYGVKTTTDVLDLRFGEILEEVERTRQSGDDPPG